MSFFKKLFSSHYRSAVALEGAGQYQEAARHYMLAGERHEVARMHWLAARDQKDPYGRVDALRKALDFMDEPEDHESLMMLQTVRRKLADSLVELVEYSGMMDRRDRGLLEEASNIYLEQEAHNEAGECFARLGYLNRAAEAFKTSGNIGRMEEMFKRVEAIDVSEAAFDRAWDAYEFARLAGDPIGAVDALARGVELRPHDASMMATLQNLKERIPRTGRWTLQGPGMGTWVLVGGESLGVGREEDNELLLMEPGVSRQHARIFLGGSGPAIEDLNSSHGTFVDGRPVAGAVTLAEHGSLRVGKDATLSYRFRPGLQPPCVFTVSSGHLKGQRFTWTPRVKTCGIPPDEPEWVPPGLALDFRRGHWHVIPEESDGPVQIDGKTLTTPTLLRLRDELVFAGVTLRVD